MGTKVTLPHITNILNSSGVATANANTDALADEFDNVHYRDGSQAATGDWDMDSNRLLNLPLPLLPTEPVRVVDMESFTGDAAMALFNTKANKLDLLAGTGSALVGWISDTAGAIARTVADVFTDQHSIMDFIPASERIKIRLGTSTMDLGPYFEAADATGSTITLPDGIYNVGRTVLSNPGTKFVGTSTTKTIIRQFDPTDHMFEPRAEGQGIENVRFEGTSTEDDVVENDGKFAIWTTTDHAATNFTLKHVVVTGIDEDHGFVNFAKFDTGCFDPVIEDIWIDSLWGTVSGTGYGILFGGVNRPLVYNIKAFGTTGRGRHFVYVSAGNAYFTVDTGYFEGSNHDAVTCYARDDQDATAGGKLENLNFVGCATSDSFNDASLSVFGNVSEVSFSHIRIKNSGGCGFRADGTDSANLSTVTLSDVTILESGYIGAEFKAIANVIWVGGTVRESSQATPETHSNIRLISDGTTTVENFIMVGVHSYGDTTARSPFQVNTTVPVPTGIKIAGCILEDGAATGIETGDSVVVINGYLQKSVTVDPPSIADGDSWTTPTPYDVPGAEVGDTVLFTPIIDGRDGVIVQGFCAIADEVKAVYFQKSGAPFDLVSHTATIKVLKV